MKTNSKLSRRSLLASAPIAAAAMAPIAATALVAHPTSAAAASGDDPIFAAIAAHRAVMKEWISLLRKARPSLEAERALEGEEKELLARLEEAENRLFAVEPATPAGMAAWLHYLAAPAGVNVSNPWTALATIGDRLHDSYNESGGTATRDMLVSRLLAAAEMLRKTAS